MSPSSRPRRGRRPAAGSSAPRTAGRRLAAMDRGAQEPAREPPVVVVEAVGQVDTARIGRGAQALGEAAVVERAVDEGPDRADLRAAFTEIFSQPRDRVVRQRLDDVGEPLAAGRDDLGLLFARHRVQDPDRPSARGAPRDLGRTQNRRLDRRVRVAATEIHRALRRAPDPSRVEERLVVPVPHAEAIVEDLGPFDEERPPLLEERLERRQVDLRRIGLDLAEVGVDRRIHGEVRRQPVLEVEPARKLVGVLVVERVGGVAGLPRHLGQRVRQELQPPGSLETSHSMEFAEVRDEVGILGRRRRPERLLLSALDDAAELDAPHAVAFGREAEHR
ncbi:hypothetical protein BH18GEM1_BH18GEM1_17320 [soil metagenome]